MSNRLINVEDLKKSYPMGKDTVEILKGVSFSMEQGEFVIIMGPSGSGKSTLLHLLAGLDRPTQGNIEVLGQDMVRSSDQELARFRNQKIGIVFQFYHLFPELDAYENVYLPSLLHKNQRSRKRADIEKEIEGLFETIGLKGRKHHRPQELSGGEQQRIAIARALVNQPDVLLADEPTGNLDSESGETILNLFSQLHQTKKLSIVMVTHNSDFLKRAQRVLYLKDGMIMSV